MTRYNFDLKRTMSMNFLYAALRKQNFHRWMLGGVIALIGSMIILPAVVAQSNEEEEPSRDGHYADYEECMDDLNDPDICGDLFHVTPTPTPTATQTSLSRPPAPYGVNTTAQNEKSISVKQSTGNGDPAKEDDRHHDTTVALSSVPNYILVNSSDTIQVNGVVEQDIHTITASASGTLGFGDNCTGPNPSMEIDNSEGQLVDHEYSWSFSVKECGRSGGTVTVCLASVCTSATIDAAPNRPPNITGGPTSVTYAENRTARVGTYTATDPEGDGITWTLEGTDSGRLSIDGSSGVLTFDSAPDYEAPDDSGTNNVYNVTVKVTDDWSPQKSTTRAVTITVINVNEKPVVASRFGIQSLPEDAITDIGLEGKFGDPDGDTLRYTASSSDTSVATESVSGSTLTITGKGAGTATIAVTAHDRAIGVSGGMSVSQSFDVTVTELTTTIAITDGPTSVSNHRENTTTVGDYDANKSAAWSLTGTDASLFSISSSGNLRFASSPNYEAPDDSGTDNVYNVTVVATNSSDTTETDERAVTITVTDVNERAEVVTTISDQIMTVGDSLSFNLNNYFRDPEGDTLRFDNSFSSDEGNILTINTTGNPLQFTATGVGLAHVIVAAIDRPSGVAGAKVANLDFYVTVTEVPPTIMITDGPTFVSNHRENTTAVGDYDANKSATWSLTGADASLFSISSSGNLRFASSPNYEAPDDSGTDNVYNVTVVATSSSDTTETDERAVTITVTDVNERAEVVTTISDQIMTVGDSLSFNLNNYFRDPEGDTLRFDNSFSSDEGNILTINTTGNPLQITATGVGLAHVIVAAIDRPSGVAGAKVANLDFYVTVTEVPPTIMITDGPTFVSNHRENTTAVGDYDANKSATWSLTGADASLFSISSSGNLRFASSPNYEAPDDSGTDNVYNVMVVATSSSDTTETDDRAITITVINVNEYPVVVNTIGPQSISVGAGLVFDLVDVFSDPDGDTLRYTASSSNNSVVTVTSSGSPITIRGRAVGTARVTVRAHDRSVVGSGGLSTSRTFTVTVTEVPPTIAITDGPTSVSDHRENTTAVGDYDANKSATWSLTGPDASLFSISSSGNLTFSRAPDYEDPDDSGTDNVYNVTVVATSSSDTTETDDRAVTITVINVNEKPVVVTTISDQTLYLNSTTRIHLTGKFRDPDGDALRYTASSSNSNIATVTSSGTPITITGEAVGTARVVTVRAHDRPIGVSGGLNVRQTFSVTVTSRPNTPPVFTEGSTATRSVSENTMSGTSIGSAIVATDNEDTRLEYSLEALDQTLDAIEVANAFNVGQSTGQLKTKNPLDYEDNNSYSFIMRVCDPSNACDTITVTVNVTDVEEPPYEEKEIEGQVLIEGADPTVLDLHMFFHDPEQQNDLYYTAQSSPTSIATATLNGTLGDTTLSLTPVKNGSTTITVTAYDLPPTNINARSFAQTFVVTVQKALTVNFDASEYMVLEDEELKVKVVLNEPSDRQHLPIPVTVTDGSAQGGGMGDYEISGGITYPGGVVTFSSGDSMEEITISATQDADEVDEQFRLSLDDMSLPKGVTVGSPASVTVTIKPRLAQPTELVVIPDSLRRANLEWTASEDATTNTVYDVEAKAPGDTWQTVASDIASAFDGYVIELDAVLPEDDSVTPPVPPKGFADEEYFDIRIVAKDSTGSLEDSRPSEIKIRDNPLLQEGGRAKANSSGEAELEWKRISDVDKYHVNVRTLQRGHGSVGWPTQEGWPYRSYFPSLTPLEVPQPSPGDPVETSDNRLTDGNIYAFQVNYVTTTAEQVFSVRDAYVWSTTAFPDNAERVATYTFFGHHEKRKFTYIICEGFDDLNTPDNEQADWTSLINDAFGQWQAATGDFIEVRPDDTGLSCATGAYDSNPSPDFLMDDDQQNEVRMLDVSEDRAVYNFPEFKSDVFKVCIEAAPACVTSFSGYSGISSDHSVRDDIIDTINAYLNDHISLTTMRAVMLELLTLYGGGHRREASQSLQGVDVTFKRESFQTTRRPDSGVQFSSCKPDLSTSEPNPDYGYFAYRTAVHEAGHALGLSNINHPLWNQPYDAAHPTIPDSIMNYDKRSLHLYEPSIEIWLRHEPDCSPHPLDVMAIYALYGTVTKVGD